VRQVRSNGANGGGPNGSGEHGEAGAGHNGAAGAGALHDTFEELVVLDRAGRVHVPQEYLEQYQIKGRARLELVDGGILIRAVDQRPPGSHKPGAGAGADGAGADGAGADGTGANTASPDSADTDSAAATAGQDAGTAKPKALRRWFGKK
jgi:bifunctional DNA-binding transcriptional regulator/antitoxin component of YhaV-PrlF toxin-antitoxin module